MIVIIDYGIGNLRSVLSKFERLKMEAAISSSIEDIQQADKLILPGVGHFGAGMTNLHQSGLVPVIEEQVLEKKKPLLGICLGMQLLTYGSEESDHPGLGWINGRVRKFEFAPSSDKKLRVPHMGWNDLTIVNPSPLLEDVPTDARFYFAHSYYVVLNVASNVIATTWYGYDVAAVLHQNNIWATQFHPEKSHRSGLRIIQNFALYA